MDGRMDDDGDDGIMTSRHDHRMIVHSRIHFEMNGILRSRIFLIDIIQWPSRRQCPRLGQLVRARLLGKPWEGCAKSLYSCKSYRM